MIFRWAPVEMVADATARRSQERHAPALRRFTVEARGPVAWAVLWASAIVLELAVVVPIAAGAEVAPGFRDVFRALGGSFLACGLIAWHRRRDSRSGLLMCLTGLCLLIEPLSVRFDSPTVQNAGEMLEDVWGIPFLALLLTINSGGRLRSRVDRLLVGGFVLQLAVELFWHFFLEQPGNFLLAFPDADIARVVEELNLWIVSTTCVAGAVVIAARWKAASPPRRRAMLPSAAGISCLPLFAAVQQYQELWFVWLAVLSLLLVPVAFLASLLRSRLARGGLAELFADLRTMSGKTLPTAVAGGPTPKLSRPVELASYFVACESLASVGRYSEARTASVSLSRTRGGVGVEIADDGVGGADAARGSGLRGVADRIEALGGGLRVTIPRGEGTVVTAEMPCGS